MNPNTSRRVKQALLCVVVTAFVMAPTPGDIGGCGQEAQLLDARAFFYNKRLTDCRKCMECGLDSNICRDACDSSAPEPDGFPEGCFPLVHDGEVCLRALDATSCSAYARYVIEDPAKRSAPSECNFCPAR